MTTPKNTRTTNGVVYDHYGKQYENMNQMCQAYNIDRSTYKFRVESGWSQKDALEKPADKSKHRKKPVQKNINN